LRPALPRRDAIQRSTSSQIVSLLPRFNPGKKFKDVLKTTEYVKGTLISEPTPEPKAWSTGTEKQ
jgi:hypothetical protein